MLTRAQSAQATRYNSRMRSLMIIAALLLAAPAVAVPLRSDSLAECQHVDGDADACRAYVNRGIREIKWLASGRVDADVWRACYDANPLHDDRGADYMAVARCVRRGQPRAFPDGRYR